MNTDLNSSECSEGEGGLRIEEQLNYYHRMPHKTIFSDHQNSFSMSVSRCPQKKFLTEISKRTRVGYTATYTDLNTMRHTLSRKSDLFDTKFLPDSHSPNTGLSHVVDQPTHASDNEKDDRHEFEDEVSDDDELQEVSDNEIEIEVVTIPITDENEEEKKTKLNRLGHETAKAGEFEEISMSDAEDDKRCSFV